jgi:hypothetical protein
MVEAFAVPLGIIDPVADGGFDALHYTDGSRPHKITG